MYSIQKSKIILQEFGVGKYYHKSAVYVKRKH